MTAARTRRIRSVKITREGRVTIPRPIRKRFGFLPHTEVAFRVDGDRVYLATREGACHPIRDGGRDLIQRMRGAATVRMTTDEITGLTRS